MAIKFPQIHIATSVINRIMNAAEGIEINPIISPDVPSITDPNVEGLELDAAIAQPVPEVAPDDGVLTAEVQGRTALDGLIDPS